LAIFRCGTMQPGMPKPKHPLSVPAQVIDAIRRIGYRRAALVILSRLSDHLFDLRYGTDTVQTHEIDELGVLGANAARAERYQGTGTIPFGKLMRLYGFPRSSVLVDFGAGKGRVLLLAMLYGFRKAVGIEFSARLCRTARENIARFASRLPFPQTVAEVIEQDVTDYVLRGDEDIFYFFNPFDEEVLRRILDNIDASLERQPRRAWIVYYHPVHAAALEARAPKFALRGEHMLSGYPCRVYCTREEAAQ